MNNKFYRNIVVSYAASLVLVGSVAAQNPRLYPPAKTSSTQTTAQQRSETKEEASGTSSKTEKSSLSMADRSFVKDAAQGGMMEVAMGREAEKNASNEEVKKFGARMVTDHGKANSELKSIAKDKGVELPGEKEAGKWKSDKEYVDMMVKDHEKDLADFEKEAKKGSDADVKRFAEKTSAVIRKHLAMAKELQGKVK